VSTGKTDNVGKKIENLPKGQISKDKSKENKNKGENNKKR
jgi:hypothetical protein